MYIHTDNNKPTKKKEMGQDVSTGKFVETGHTLEVTLHFGKNHATFNTIKVTFDSDRIKSVPAEKFREIKGGLHTFFNHVKADPNSHFMMAITIGTKNFNGVFFNLSKNDHLHLHADSLARSLDVPPISNLPNSNRSNRGTFDLQWMVPLHPEVRAEFADLIYRMSRAHDVWPAMPTDDNNVTGNVLAKFLRLYESGQEHVPPLIEDSRDKNGIFLIAGHRAKREDEIVDSSLARILGSTLELEEHGKRDSEHFVQGPNLVHPREEHVSARLPDGTVVVAGGRVGPGLFTVMESLSPGEEGFRVCGYLKKERMQAACSVTPKGNFVMCGGTFLGMPYYDTIEVFDFARNSNRLLRAKLSSPRADHKAICISEDELFVCGGSISMAYAPLNTVEIVNIKTGQVRMCAPMAFPRAGHAAVLMLDGNIFICGNGTAEIYSPRSQTTVQIFVDIDMQFHLTDAYQQEGKPRPKFDPLTVFTADPFAALMRNGDVLIGDLSFTTNNEYSTGTFIFDFKTGRFKEGPGVFEDHISGSVTSY
jgi:hypothetical protein